MDIRASGMVTLPRVSVFKDVILVPRSVQLSSEDHSASKISFRTDAEEGEVELCRWDK